MKEMLHSAFPEVQGFKRELIMWGLNNWMCEEKISDSWNQAKQNGSQRTETLESPLN